MNANGVKKSGINTLVVNFDPIPLAVLPLDKIIKHKFTVKNSGNKYLILDFDGEIGDFDTLYHQAVSIIIQHQKASTSYLQRHLQIGYNRAARMIEQMEKEGIITEANHVGKRSVLKKSI